MRPVCFYAVQSDRYLNVQFRRRWAEPTWVLRLDEKPPPRPPDKRRGPALAPTSNRPLIKSTTTSALDNSCHSNKTEARRNAKALFAPGSAV